MNGRYFVMTLNESYYSHISVHVWISRILTKVVPSGMTHHGSVMPLKYHYAVTRIRGNLFVTIVIRVHHYFQMHSDTLSSRFLETQHQKKHFDVIAVALYEGSRRCRIAAQADGSVASVAS